MSFIGLFVGIIGTGIICRIAIVVYFPIFIVILLLIVSVWLRLLKILMIGLVSILFTIFGRLMTPLAIFLLDGFQLGSFVIF